jgi:hypothetical protein
MTPTERTEINRANAHHSTGPKTKEGKQRSSMNALKHGLTSNSATIPSDNLDDYERHVQSYFDTLQPNGPVEADLVQSLAEIAWRMKRVIRLEDEIIELPLYSQLAALATLGAHSQRLSRQYERTEKHLRELQEIRRAQEQNELEELLNIVEIHESKGESYNPTEHGFVFSKSEIAAARRLRSRAQIARKAAA